MKKAAPMQDQDLYVKKINEVVMKVNVGYAHTPRTNSLRSTVWVAFLVVLLLSFSSTHYRFGSLLNAFMNQSYSWTRASVLPTIVSSGVLCNFVVSLES